MGGVLGAVIVLLLIAFIVLLVIHCRVILKEGESKCLCHMTACIGAAIGTQNHSKGQGAEDKIEMTQNQVYGVRQPEGGDSGGDVTMQANVVYGVNEDGLQGNHIYDYI